MMITVDSEIFNKALERSVDRQWGWPQSLTTSGAWTEPFSAISRFWKQFLDTLQAEDMILVTAHGGYEQYIMTDGANEIRVEGLGETLLPITKQGQKSIFSGNSTSPKLGQQKNKQKR